MSNSTTDQIHIANPEMWVLQLSLQPECISFIAYAPEIPDSLISNTIDLHFAGENSYRKAVENAVYDNPVLLNDFSQVRILVQAPQFSLLPPGVTATVAQGLFQATYGPCSLSDFATCILPKSQLTIAFSMVEGLQGFLQRTFNMPPIYHHLYPQCEHLSRTERNHDTHHTLLNITGNRLDVVVTYQHQIILANSFIFKNIQEAAYYALHIFETLKLDQETNTIQLIAEKDVREGITPILRQYVRYVMPAIFPAAALRLGQAAMKAPRELILLALCE